LVETFLFGDGCRYDVRARVEGILHDISCGLPAAGSGKITFKNQSDNWLQTQRSAWKPMLGGFQYLN
jgi:hypothetical protein